MLVLFFKIKSKYKYIFYLFYKIIFFIKIIYFNLRLINLKKLNK